MTLSVIGSFRKNRFIRKICNKMLRLRQKRSDWIVFARPILKQRRKCPNAVYFVMTPEHGNMGDHAIAEATSQMLRELSIEYVEITTKALEQLKKNKWLGIMNHKTIIVNGGGNLGTLWFGVEDTFRKLVIANPDSSVFCLPNTMFYEDSDWGRSELEKSIMIYNNHAKLKLYAREMISYKMMKRYYNQVAIVPDMALLMNKCINGTVRNGCLLCLRNDKERTRSDDTEANIVAQVKLLFGDNYRHTDMCIDHGVTISSRHAELEAKYDEFRSAELVVTDRLHGMIFAAITGTPCIVIGSMSHKVKGCFEWLRDLEYIRFIDSAKDLMLEFDTIPQKEFVYDNSKLIPMYDVLKNDLRKAADKEYKHA